MIGLSRSELLAVLEAARARRERDWLMFLLAYNHALRISEVVGIRRDDVEDGFLDVRRKKGSRRTVQPLVHHTNPLLNEAQPLLDFCAGMHGNQVLFPISTRQVERLFARYAEAAGLPKHKRHPHVLKHTCGLQLLASAAVNDVQRWMGHKSGASTLEYLKHSDEEATPSCLRALAT